MSSRFENRLNFLIEIEWLNSAAQDPKIIKLEPKEHPLPWIIEIPFILFRTSQRC